MSWPLYGGIAGVIAVMHHLLVIQMVEKSPRLHSIVWHKPSVTHTKMYKVKLRRT